MLKLYNKEHEAIGVLTNLKDYKVEYVLSGEDLLEFSLSVSDENIYLVEEEGYIRTKNNEYVIKAIEYSDNFKRFTCDANVEDLVGKAIASFDTSNNNINDTIRLAIAGTGWILADNNITKRRTVRLTNTNALEVLREVRKVFSVDFRYDAINKIIHVYEKFGEDRGVYFSDELNLKSFSIPSDTYDYVTRLYPYGKDGLNISSVNNGKEYIENFQYSNKVLELIWEDNRYTVAENLLEDAKAKLDELSKPKRSYQASIVDLAKQSEEYSYLDFFLGDTITLLSKQEKFRDKQRIVKYIEYPDDPSQNTCELGNTTLTFEDLQKENEAKNNTVDAITSDNGTVDGSKVDSITTEQISDFESEVAKITDLTVVNAEIENLKAQDVTITGKLSAVEGEFGTLKANVGTIDKLTVTHTAQINNLEANKASIVDLNAVRGEITLLESEVAKIGTLEADVADIEHVLAGNITSDNIASGTITADKMATGTITAGSGVIANGAIGNAQISSLSANKIDTGEIDTSKVKVKGKDGFLLIENNTLYVTDNNRQIRVELGQIENNTNYGFIVRGADGQTILLDHNGVRNAGITDGAIDNRKVSENANISGKKLDIDSVIKTINEDGSVKIQGTTVQVGNTTLDVKLSEQNNLITEQGKKLETQQAEITANTNAIKLKVDNQTYQTDKTNMTTQMNKNTSEISAMKGEIALKVEQSDITNAIDNIQVGGRNLLYKYIRAGGATKKIDDLTVQVGTTNLDTYFYVKVTTDILVGETYTLSCEAFNVPEGCNWLFGIRAQNSKNRLTINKNGKCYVSFVMDQTVTKDKEIILDDVIGRPSTPPNIMLTNFKLEKGNKPTDWTPAPEDVSSEIENKVSTAKAEIKVTTDAISQNVSNLSQTVSTKADGSIVSSLSNKVGSLETSINGISGKVSSLETTTTSISSTATSALNKANSASTAASNAQSTANTAKNTADSKAKVFTSTPTTPYKVGDIWTAGPSGDLMKCKTARTSGSYTASDWEKASKYTDDTKANAVDGKVNTLQGEVSTVKSNVASLDVNLQGITQRVSSTESTVSSHTTQLGTVDSRINTAKNSAISTASSDATTKANNALASAKTDATTKANNALADAKTYTNGQITTVNKTITDKVAEIKLTTDNITQRVSNTESTTTTLTNKINDVNSNINKTTELAKAMSLGKMLYQDPIFKQSINGVKLYNNSGGSHVTVTRITKPSDAPTTSTHCVEIKTIGTTTSPGRGGFYFGNATRANAIFITRIIAKIPIGYTINFASNSTGDGGSQKWLTSNVGTGKWEEYIYKVQCGSSGSFSSTNFFYLTGGSAPTTSAPLVWYLAYATVFNVTDMDYTVQEHTTQITNTNNKVASIETNLNSITSRVSSVENTTTTINGNITNLQSRMNSAEQKITSDAIVSTVTSSQTYKNGLNGKVSTNQVISTINQTAEAIKINANKVELSGYTTFSNLATSGQTTINADNLKTGTIEAIQIKACHFSGKNMIYIEDNGTLSCDGYTYLKHLFIPETHPGWAEGTIGSFSCAPNAWFDRDVHVTNEIYTRGTGVVRRQNGVYIQVDALGVQNTNNNNWLLINCYQSNHAFGVDLWYSDKNLKENIVILNSDVKDIDLYDNVKIGLDLINSINHYSYNYKETLGLGNEHVDCGYIAQQLQSLNPNLVRTVPQQDGSILLEPRASMIIPHLSKAIQEQQDQIDFLNKEIEFLKKEINILKVGE